jgi:HTH-type transcriptional regulator/antitoxin HigA
MNVFPIRSEADYKSALKEVSKLVDLDPAMDTEEGARLEVLSTLIEAYESRTFPMDLPSPAEAIKFRMEQGGLAPTDLVESIGKINRVYEVLAGRRAPSVKMIRRLYVNFGIPAESLIGLPIVTVEAKMRGGKVHKKVRKGRPSDEASNYGKYQPA